MEFPNPLSRKKDLIRLLGVMKLRLSYKKGLKGTVLTLISMHETIKNSHKPLIISWSVWPGEVSLGDHPTCGLRANVCKDRAKSIFRGHSQKIIFTHILSIDRHKQVTKRGVVCFSKGRLDLEKIDKINFRGRRLKNNQNLRQNEAVSKLRSHAHRKKAG